MTWSNVTVLQCKVTHMMKHFVCSNWLRCLKTRYRLCSKLFRQLVSQSHILHCLLAAQRDVGLTGRLRPRNKYPTVRARTNRFKNSFNPWPTFSPYLYNRVWSELTCCNPLSHSRLACSRLSAHIEPSVNNPRRQTRPILRHGLS